MRRSFLMTAPMSWMLFGSLLIVGLPSHVHAAEVDDAADAAAVAAIEKIGGSVRRIASDSDEREVDFHLGGRDLTDKGLMLVAALKNNVVHLHLKDTKITSAGLVHLKALTKLRRLHLERTEVGDEGIEFLKGLSELEYLNLYATNVTDKSLEHFKALKKLKRLYLWQTDVSDEAVALLEEALPELKIIRGAALNAASTARKRILIDEPTLPIAGQSWKVAGVRYEDASPGSEAEGKIYFRETGASQFAAADLIRDKEGRFEGTVPGAVTGKPFQYYIRIREPKQAPSTYPPFGAKAPAEVTPDAAPPALAEAPQAGDAKSYLVAISWIAATDDRGIAAYEIYRGKEQASAVAAENLLAKLEPDQLQYRDEKPPAGQTVFYAVRPVDVAGRTGEARTVKVEVPKDIPPTNELKLAASAGSKAVVLDWSGTAEPDVEQILVFRADSAEGEAAQVAELKLAEHQRWIDQGVKDDVKYRYYIRLRDAGGLISEPSGEVTAEAGGFLRRINCGGEEVASPDGTPWEADTGRVAGTGRFNAKTTIAGVTDQLQPLYQTERWSYRGIRYRFDASPGHYRATLHFAETNNAYSAVGKRTFDVLVNGEKLHAAVDIFAKAGKATAWQLDAEFEVTGDEILIELKKVAAGPAIKGLEVREISKAEE